jgi:hypothetical protein
MELKIPTKSWAPQDLSWFLCSVSAATVSSSSVRRISLAYSHPGLTAVGLVQAMLRQGTLIEKIVSMDGQLEGYSTLLKSKRHLSAVLRGIMDSCNSWLRSQVICLFLWSVAASVLKSLLV